MAQVYHTWRIIAPSIRFPTESHSGSCVLYLVWCRPLVPVLTAPRFVQRHEYPQALATVATRFFPSSQHLRYLERIKGCYLR